MDSKGRSLITLLVGAGLGFMASVLMSDEKKAKLKSTTKDKYRQLKNTMGERIDTDMLREKLGDAGARTELMYYRTKDTVMDRLSKLQGGLEDIDKRKYEDIVNEVVDELRSERDVAKGVLDNLRDYLKSDFKKLRDSLK